MSEKSRVEGKEESLLDKFDDNITTFALPRESRSEAEVDRSISLR